MDRGCAADVVSDPHICCTGCNIFQGDLSCPIAADDEDLGSPGDRYGSRCRAAIGSCWPVPDPGAAG